MKFQDTIFWREYSNYSKVPRAGESSYRCSVDGYILYKLFQEYKFTKILEVGFLEGLTTGLIAEISPDTARILSIDNNPRTELFNKFYKDLSHKVTIISDMLQNVTLDKKFNFIHLDTGKNSNEIISKVLTLLENDGVLVVDTYWDSDTKSGICDIVYTNNLVPFMKTDQSIFFHSPSVDRSTFLDHTISLLANNFINFENEIIDGFVVLSAKSLPIFTTRLDFFNAAIKEYNL